MKSQCSELNSFSNAFIRCQFIIIIIQFITILIIINYQYNYYKLTPLLKAFNKVVVAHSIMEPMTIIIIIIIIIIANEPAERRREAGEAAAL